jgi:hypothetical protein
MHRVMWGLGAVLALSCGGESQGPECFRMLYCADEVDEDGAPALESTYGPEAACWDSKDSAAACETECAALTADYLGTYPLSEACNAADAPTAADAFGPSDAWTYAIDTELFSTCGAFYEADSAEVVYRAGEGETLNADVRILTESGALIGEFSTTCELRLGGSMYCDTVEAPALVVQETAGYEMSALFDTDVHAGDLRIVGLWSSPLYGSCDEQMFGPGFPDEG